MIPMMQIDCEVSDTTLLYFDNQLAAQFRSDAVDRQYFEGKEFATARDFNNRVRNP